MTIDTILKQLEAWQAENKEGRSLLIFFSDEERLGATLSGYDTELKLAIESSAYDNEPISKIILQSATNIALGDDSPNIGLFKESLGKITRQL